MFDALKRFSDRVFNPKRFTDQLWHDAFHAITALAVAIAVWRIFDMPGDLAVFLGWLIPVFLIEGLKDLSSVTRFPSRDSIHDIATYLPIVAVWLFLKGDLFAAIALATAIGASFVGFYYEGFKVRWAKQ